MQLNSRKSPIRKLLKYSIIENANEKIIIEKKFSFRLKKEIINVAVP